MPNLASLRADDLEHATVFEFDQARLHRTAFWSAEKCCAALPGAAVVVGAVDDSFEIVVLRADLWRGGNGSEQAAGLELDDAGVVHHVVAGFGHHEHGRAPRLGVVGGAADVGFEVGRGIFLEVEKQDVAGA